MQYNIILKGEGDIVNNPGLNFVTYEQGLTDKNIIFDYVRYS